MVADLPAKRYFGVPDALLKGRASLARQPLQFASPHVWMVNESDYLVN